MGSQIVETSNYEDYIGEIYVKDMYAFCRTKFQEGSDESEPNSKRETGIVKKIRASKNEYRVFQWSAFFNSGKSSGD